MPIDYQLEQDFFDRIAAHADPQPIDPQNLRRYQTPRWPELFSKEKMFHLAGNLRDRQVLEVGCGEGLVSVQLASCGAKVRGVDLSPRSIEVARRRAEIQGLSVQFDVLNVVEAETFGQEAYDLIWCDLILHHLVDSLDAVMAKIVKALKPGGMFIAREPLNYAGWLRYLRSLTPLPAEFTPDEQPLRESELQIVRKHFPQMQEKRYRLFARLDQVVSNLGFLRVLARMDRCLLAMPGFSSLAGTTVLWATKQQ